MLSWILHEESIMPQSVAENQTMTEEAHRWAEGLRAVVDRISSRFPRAVKKYPAEFKERAVQLAVESDQPIAQTARDLGINANTLYTWIGKYHQVERQEKEVHDEHLYEELQRLRKENARLKEERAIF